MSPIELDPDQLSLADVVAVARHHAEVIIPEESLQRVAQYRASVEQLAEAQRPVYGVSTGSGRRSAPHPACPSSRKSPTVSSAAGMGEPVESEVAAMMLLRARTLATGRTGVRAEVLTTYVEILNAGLIPVVYEYGSLGCSGDLAPLAACALVLMGEGEALDAEGRPAPAGEALAAARNHPWWSSPRRRAWL